MKADLEKLKAIAKPADSGAEFRRGYHAAVSKAVEFIKTTPMYAKQPSQGIEELKKYMED